MKLNGITKYLGIPALAVGAITAVTFFLSDYAGFAKTAEVLSVQVSLSSVQVSLSKDIYDVDNKVVVFAKENIIWQISYKLRERRETQRYLSNLRIEKLRIERSNTSVPVFLLKEITDTEVDLKEIEEELKRLQAR